MKSNLFASAAVMALLAVAPAQANQCDDQAAAGKASVSVSYDAYIAHYEALYAGGARVVELDIDGEGESPVQEYRVDKLIEILKSRRDEDHAKIDAVLPACHEALADAEETQKQILLVDPVGTVASGLLDAQLAKLGMGENNDIRGLVGFVTNPGEAVVKVFTEPDEVVKAILHKPQDLIIAPWKILGF